MWCEKEMTLDVNSIFDAWISKYISMHIRIPFDCMDVLRLEYLVVLVSVNYKFDIFRRGETI